MSRLLMCLVFVLLLAAGCQSATPEPPPDPLTLVTQASENIRALTTFKMIVEQTGAPYFIETDLGRVQFRRAEAQYRAPNELQAQVRLLIVGGIPAVADIFSRGENQWYRNEILTTNRWYNAPFSPGFNPETLIAEETGFQSALAALVDMNYIGTETLESGATTYHLSATASGDQITALLAGLIYLDGEVNVDLYIDKTTLLPVRFIIVDPDTVSEAEPDPTTWTIDIYDFDGEVTLEDPAAAPDTIPAAPLLLTPIGAEATAEAGE